MHISTAFRSPGRALAAAFFVFLSLGSLAGRAQAETVPILANTTGEQKTLVLLVNYQDKTTQPISVADAHALVFGTVSDFYWEGSYQQTFLSGDTYGWYTVPVSAGVCNNNLLAQEADKQATAAGIDVSKYSRVMYLTPDSACSAGGYNSGSVLPTRMWINSNNIVARLITHELGHNFGLLHSGSIDCGDSVLGQTCTSSSYGDPADSMGSGSATHFNATHKEVLGWLNTSGQPPLTEANASGSYSIAPFESTGTVAKALKIPRGIDAGSGRMSYYYLEYRQSIGFDMPLGSVGNLTGGVQVRTGGVNQPSVLLDMTPGSYPTSEFNDAQDSALTVGKSYVDSAAGITITLKSADAEGAVITVSLGGGGAPTCTRAAPTLSLSGPTAAVAAGSTQSYALSLRNNDSSACAATSFSLARSVPSGWSGTLAASSLSLSPGASSNTTLSVTSATAAAAGSYSIGVGSSSANGSAHTASAAATYAVAAPVSSSLSESVGTDKTSYLRGESVAMSARVLNAGVAVAGASVRFTITLPGGSTVVSNATTGSDGYARSSYKLGKGKSAIGTYQLRADASNGGATATAATSFSGR